MADVYVAAVGMTKFGKSSQTLTELFCEAATRALAAFSVEVEALYIGVNSPGTAISRLKSRMLSA